MRGAGEAEAIGSSAEVSVCRQMASARCALRQFLKGIFLVSPEVPIEQYSESKNFTEHACNSVKSLIIHGGTVTAKGAASHLGGGIMKLKSLVAVALAVASIGAQATLITYSNSATFQSLYTGLALEDFQDVSSIGQVLAGTNITTGVAFSLTSGSDAYLAPAGQSANPTQAIGVNTPASAGWNIDFSAAVDAASFEVFQNVGGGSQSGGILNAVVQVFGASGLLGSFIAAIPSGSGAFFGVFSDSDLITRLTVNAPTSFDVIDNVNFGQVGAASVPEPTTLALLGLALVGVCATTRKRAA